MNLLESIQPMHMLHALLVGAVAGFLVVIIDNYVIVKVEAAVGITPTAA